MLQKIRQVGNSAGILIPQEILRELNFRVGDQINVDKKGDKIVIVSPKKKLAKGVDAKFAKMVDEFIEDHKDVLAELAKR